MVRLLRGAVVPAVLVALTALPGLVLGRIYSGSLLVALVGGAALGSVGVGVAARRLPSWTVAPLSVLLLAGYTAAAVRMTADRAALPGPLRSLAADALGNGIPRLLTAMIPVEPTPDTVVVPVISAWLAGLAGAELALRAGRVLLGCVPAAVLFAGALYVVGPNADSGASRPTLAFAALVAVALAVSARPAGRAVSADIAASAGAAVRTRALAGTAVGVAAVVGVIAAVGPWVGARVAATPVDPRQYVQPPQVDALDESPLNRISGWSLDPDQQLFRVSFGATPSPGAGADARTSPAGRGPRLRLAVLPDYDGVTWRVGATYRNAGRVLPTPPALPGARVQPVRQEITVDELAGRLLPAVPTPTGIEGARVAYDAGTGTLIRPEGLTPGVRYTVTSARELPDLNLLPGADVPAGAAVARFLSVGTGVPEQVQRLADQLAGGNGAAYDRATAIQEFLAEHYRKVPDAPSGHAYPNLSFFLFGPRDRGGQRGTSEQFAASFALLARLMGLPARIVVGFDAPASGGPVRGADASAWPEVLFDDLGWVPFDPLPRGDEPPRPVEEDFSPKPVPPTPTAPAPSSADEPSASAAPTVLAAAPARGTPTTVVAGGVSATVLLAVAGLACTVVLLRRSQRRRRLAGAPETRIAGAWLEFTDALRLAGRPAPAHLAATEVAAHAATAPPLRRSAPAEPAPMPPVDDLVVGVNTSAFAPGAADPSLAERAGTQAVAYADALRANRSWWRRALWSVHPGPLRWHRGR